MLRPLYGRKDAEYLAWSNKCAQTLPKEAGAKVPTHRGIQPIIPTLQPSVEPESRRIEEAQRCIHLYNQSAIFRFGGPKSTRLESLHHDSRVLDYRNVIMWHLWGNSSQRYAVRKWKKWNRWKEQGTVHARWNATLASRSMEQRKQQILFQRLKVDDSMLSWVRLFRGLKPSLNWDWCVGIGPKKFLQSCGTVCHNVETLSDLSIGGLRILDAWLVSDGLCWKIPLYTVYYGPPPSSTAFWSSPRSLYILLFKKIIIVNYCDLMTRP